MEKGHLLVITFELQVTEKETFFLCCFFILAKKTPSLPVPFSKLHKNLFYSAGTPYKGVGGDGGVSSS